jgi:betaine-aldehyde dehydrogenase
LHIYKELFVGGKWTPPSTSDTIEVISPHDLKLVGTVPAASEADVDAAVSAARSSFDSGIWCQRPVAERIAVMRRLHDLYASRLDEIIELQSLEIGSPITFSKSVTGPAPLMTLATFLDNAGRVPWEETRRGITGLDIIVRREAVGVVAIIVPWNAPQFTLMAKLAPALIAGCSVVIKPSPETPLDSNIVADLVAEAGVPPGVVSVLPAGREVGQYLVAHPKVDKVAFTGSTAAGRKIAAICGEQLKRCSLELGGKSAAIILEDADLTATAAGLQYASLANSGQACIAQTRILAPRSRYAETVDAIAEMMSAQVVGDPFDPGTDIGPMVSQRQQHRVNSYIELGTQEGARLVVGGARAPEGLDRGWYVRPTLFADVDNTMRIAREEIFGPVLVVIPYDDEEEAVRIANDSDYGLAGSVWTADVEHGIDIGRRVRTGTFSVNQYWLDLNAPFGGFKASGIGREMGIEGFNAYIEYKSIAPGPPVDNG